MIIILEGENKTGKSTIAKYISKKYHFRYWKCSQPEGDPYVEYMSILKNIEKVGGNWVLDRFLWGEQVYGPIYRGKSQIDDQQFRNIELKALALGAEVIYCYDRIENIARRFKADNEDWANEKNIKKTLLLYDKVVRKSILPITLHRMKTRDDITINGVLDQMEIIKNKVYKTVIGNTRNPRIVFIGDKRNENQKKKYKKFAQPFDFGPASKFFFENLKKVGIELYNVAIVNSDSKELNKFLKDMFFCADDAIFVALGGSASDKLSKLGWNVYYNLCHPQYANRFHHNDRLFANQLRTIK